MNIGPNYISAQEWQTLFDKKNEIASPPLNKLPTEPEPKKPRDPNAEFYTTEETPWFSSYKNSAAGRAILENMPEKQAKEIRGRYLENHIRFCTKSIAAYNVGYKPA
ncbi:hypothetical protein [Pseudomonas syringae]|uniref:hypothetical protein n=1 Tax=Pseudomonas syringae TaxID=317 RepID=UPI000DC647F2|nr:hypothetical protein PSCFBP6110_01656 [Pseudomonas syringae pv. cerasicola]